MSHQPLLSRILFVYCLLALSAAPARAQTDTASISGRVTLNGAPARGVRVTLAPGPYGDSKTSGRQNMRADEEGRFEFTGLKPGRYGLLAASYVYVSEDLFSQPMRPFKLCTVSAGEKLTGQDLRMVRGGVITGRVTQADGRPAINERLHLSFVDAGGKRTAFPWEMNYEMRATDDRGVYRIFGLPPGRYLVRASGAGGGAMVIELRAPSTAAFTLPLAPEAALSLRLATPGELVHAILLDAEGREILRDWIRPGVPRSRKVPVGELRLRVTTRAGELPERRLMVPAEGLELALPE